MLEDPGYNSGIRMESKRKEVQDNFNALGRKVKYQMIRKKEIRRVEKASQKKERTEMMKKRKKRKKEGEKGKKKQRNE